MKYAAIVASPPIKVCECGCGTEIPTAKYPSQQSRFVNGHNARKFKGPAYIPEDRGYESPCWIWQKTKSKTGYGVEHRGKPPKMMMAHRIVYEEVAGPIEPKHDLHHLCYVKLCVNPAHMEVMSRKRHGKVEAEYRAPLDWMDVRKIRKLRDELTQEQLAKAFGVQQTTISKIILGLTWRDDSYVP